MGPGRQGIQGTKRFQVLKAFNLKAGCVDLPRNRFIHHASRGEAATAGYDIEMSLPQVAGTVTGGRGGGVFVLIASKVPVCDVCGVSRCHQCVDNMCGGELGW